MRSFEEIEEEIDKVSVEITVAIDTEQKCEKRLLEIYNELIEQLTSSREEEQ